MEKIVNLFVKLHIIIAIYFKNNSQITINQCLNDRNSDREERRKGVNETRQSVRNRFMLTRVCNGRLPTLSWRWIRSGHAVRMIITPVDAVPSGDCCISSS